MASDNLLSTQQLAVMQHLADGLIGKEIAAAMNLAYTTVRTHIRKAKKKLGARTQERAVALAVARGFVIVSMDSTAPALDTP